MELTSSLRSFSLLAAPATLVALGLMAGAVAGSGQAVESSPLGIASTAAVLLVLFALAALAPAAALRLRRAGRSAAGPAIAAVGSVLVAGGAWASLFVLPGIETAAPSLLTSGRLAGVTVGFVASYAVFAVGWAVTAVGLVRGHAVPAWLGALLAVGAVVALLPAPEPARLLIVSVAAWLTARRLGVPAAEEVAQLTASI